MPGDRSEEELMQTSFLTVGGWESEDYKGDIAWFDTGKGWNQTLTEVTYDGKSIVQKYDMTEVMFETGYPYIGMSERFFDNFASALYKNSNDFDCTKGKHWGLCRVVNRTCEDLNLNQLLKF